MKRTFLITTLLAFAAPNCALFGASFSFTGNFSSDDEIRLFQFGLDAVSDVTIRTLGFDGGTNAAGEVIPAGGFESELAVFNGLGTLLNPTVPALVPGDVELTLNDLGPGTFFVALTQFQNFALGDLDQGFFFEGAGNFTAVEGCPAGQFCAEGGEQRTSFFAVDVTGVDRAADVPEPSSLLLLTGGLALAWRLRRRAA